jgi:hypothetical protein
MGVQFDDVQPACTTKVCSYTHAAVVSGLVMLYDVNLLCTCDEDYVCS